jgi:PAS domain S-box-containing protein
MKEIIVEPDKLIISKTDTKGIITYGNRYFTQISGYQTQEYMHKPHNILRHGDMPKAVFKLLWKVVFSGNEIHAFVKNRAKDGSYYWVFTNVSPSYDANGNIVGFFSVRRKPSKKGIETIIPVYAQMLEAEKKGGVDAGVKKLMQVLNSLNVEYEDLILALQED